MHVRLLTDRADRGYFQQEGEIVEVSAKEATALIKARQAEAIDDPEKPEAAVEPRPRNASRK